MLDSLWAREGTIYDFLYMRIIVINPSLYLIVLCGIFQERNSQCNSDPARQFLDQSRQDPYGILTFSSQMSSHYHSISALKIISLVCYNLHNFHSATLLMSLFSISF